jgi:peptide-methionine (S)-S-oxide reductase
MVHHIQYLSIMEAKGKTEIALLGGGCFWCLEAAFERVPGVKSATSGYAGGESQSPSYEEVCSGESGHAEVLRLAFDPGLVSYREILSLFWKLHDPTTLNRQGADVGTQYRSVIFYADESQRRSAEVSMAEQAGLRGAALATELLPAPPFWPAEDYHQGYFRKHPEAGYCRVVIAPKLARLFSP